MYQEKKRERRRRDYLRMKARAKRQQRYIWGDYFNEKELNERSARLANNLKACSCCMCGNPRKWWNELTIQERRFYQVDKYEE